ncbi:hypothetical protein WMF31_00865 [Sorangium sp. So ce1036]|uniref:hypothetical protein n=1 Tax=Sorangium sp. So ce1036 TaxID=3133328 RepID=UPI003F03F29F
MTDDAITIRFNSEKSHSFLRYISPKPHRRVVHELAVALMNQYFNASLSRRQWLKQPRQPAAWHFDNHSRKSKPIDINIIESLLETGTFDFNALDIFDPRCNWLDSSIHIKARVHLPGSDGKSVVFRIPTNLGSSFPYVPHLDREGHALNSLQIMSQKRILELHSIVVSESHSYDQLSWFQNLRSYICECVSLIDMTLHQIYYKARYSPLPGWTFNKNKLGPRFGRRLSDKIAWIYKITSKHLGAEDELKEFYILKDLRNHLQHFDPPCICYTLEDVAHWLNGIHSVAALAWKIRKCIGSPLSVPLIEMLLTPVVEFVPSDTSLPRIPQPSNVGYASTRPRDVNQ